MHILIIPSWYPATSKDIGGSFFREQAIALYRHGCTVGVIVTHFRPMLFWKWAFKEKYGHAYEFDEGIHTYRYYTIRWLPAWIPYSKTSLWVHYGLKLFSQYVRNHGMPDIIHVHSMLNAGPLARKIKEKYNVNYVVTEHHSAFARGVLKPWQINLCKNVIEKSSKRIAVSDAFAHFLQYFLNLEAKEWISIPNIVGAQFEKAPFTKRDRTTSPFVFINISLQEPKKGIDLLLRAFSIVYEKTRSVALVIGGDGPERKNLEKLAKDLGISQAVSFKGMLSRNEVVDAMDQSHVYVLSSRFETFGVVLIESLALGRPVIATRCGGPESIVGPEDGFLVPADDINALADAMQTIYEKYNDFDQGLIRQKCLERFGEDRIISELIYIYTQCIQ